MNTDWQHGEIIPMGAKAAAALCERLGMDHAQYMRWAAGVTVPEIAELMRAEYDREEALRPMKN